MYIKNNPHLWEASGKARAPEQRVDRLSYSVRFTLKSGRKVADAGMSANDPTRKLMISDASLVAGMLLMGLTFDTGIPHLACRLTLFGEEPPYRNGFR